MLTGDSAGAELALVCHCINQSEEMQRVFKVKPIHFDIQAMVLTHPVCFIDQAGTIPQSQFLSKHFGVPGLQRFLYGKNYHESEEYQYSVNPTKFIDENMTFPPILLVTSEGILHLNIRHSCWLICSIPVRLIIGSILSNPKMLLTFSISANLWIA